MRIKVFSLSLSTWYQSQGRKLYSFWFTRVINFENPSTDCVSFRSPFPSPKAFRSVISWSENPHHRQKFSDDFSGDFFRWYFPTPTTSSGAQRRDLQLFSKHQSQKPTHTPPTRHFSPAAWIPRTGTWGRVDHFLVPSFFQQAPPALSWTCKPPSVLFEPCFSILLAFQPPRVFFQPLRVFFPPPTATPFLGRDLCVPWEGLFFISSHFSPLFGSRHTRFFFHSCDPTSL